MFRPSASRVAHRHLVAAYGRRHAPPSPGDSPWAYDLGSGEFLPLDVLTHPERYTTFREQVRSFWPSILKAQGKPGARITIYRALPGTFTTFNPGDWVTPSLQYARRHIASNGDASWHVIEATVPANTVIFGGDDLVEWGYLGPTIEGKIAR